MRWACEIVPRSIVEIKGKNAQIIANIPGNNRVLVIGYNTISETKREMCRVHGVLICSCVSFLVPCTSFVIREDM